MEIRAFSVNLPLKDPSACLSGTAHPIKVVQTSSLLVDASLGGWLLSPLVFGWPSQVPLSTSWEFCLAVVVALSEAKVRLPIPVVTNPSVVSSLQTHWCVTKHSTSGQGQPGALKGFLCHTVHERWMSAVLSEDIQCNCTDLELWSGFSDYKINCGIRMASSSFPSKSRPCINGHSLVVSVDIMSP